MKQILIIVQKEFLSYFSTPLAYVFIAIFLMLNGICTFLLGGFFETGQADLKSFFSFHPWLYLFLIPAIAMRSWAEERQSGTIELLMTLPIRQIDAVLGKFFAAWCFCAVALFLTFPIWLTVNYLGDPDNGVIFASYLGSLMMAGSFLAIGSCLSATTNSQVVAFILTVVVCFLFLLCGEYFALHFLQSFLPGWLIEAISLFSFRVHFESISRGVIDFRDIVYFLLVISVWLIATTVVVDIKKAD